MTKKITRRPPGKYAIHFTEPSLTSQAFAHECDINNILKSPKTAEQLQEMMKSNPGTYGDFSNVPTYMDAQNILIVAREQFEALPAKMRARFNHDPSEFLEFVHTPENQKELVKMGLAVAIPQNEDSTNPPTTPTPTPPPVVPGPKTEPGTPKSPS